MSIFPSTKSKNVKSPPKEPSVITTQIVGILTITSGILSLLSVATFSPADPVLFFVEKPFSGNLPDNAVGWIGATLAFFLFMLLGNGAYLVPLLLILVGVSIVWSENLQLSFSSWLGSLVGLLSISALLHLHDSTASPISSLGGQETGKGGII